MADVGAAMDAEAVFVVDRVGERAAPPPAAVAYPAPPASDPACADAPAPSDGAAVAGDAVALPEGAAAASETLASSEAADAAARDTLSAPEAADVAARDALSAPEAADTAARETLGAPDAADAAARESLSAPEAADAADAAARDNLSAPEAADAAARGTLSVPEAADAAASEVVAAPDKADNDASEAAPPADAVAVVSETATPAEACAVTSEIPTPAETRVASTEIAAATEPSSVTTGVAAPAETSAGASGSVAPSASVAPEGTPEQPEAAASEHAAPSESAAPTDAGAGASDAVALADAKPVPSEPVAMNVESDVAAKDSAQVEASGPIPDNLPKLARSRPSNARVFIGNLASEYTDVKEIISVFYKYGELIEEPVLRRSFGFVQYSTAEAARNAVAAEQSRVIGGIPIDLSIADNREVKKGTHVANNTPFPHGQKGPTAGSAVGVGASTAVAAPTRGRARGDRDNHNSTAGGAQSSGGSRKRRRSLSPASAARKGGVHPPQYRRQRPEPRGGVHLRILCMSPTARAYARHCDQTFNSMTGLRAEILNIVAAGLGEALGRAMREVIPYVMVVASKDVEDGTCTIRTLEKTGYEKAGRGNGIIPLREAIEVCLIERGVIVPPGLAALPLRNPNNPVPGVAPAGMSAMASGVSSMNIGGVPPGPQWAQNVGVLPVSNAHAGAVKPGWMSGPRASAMGQHPQASRAAMQQGGMHRSGHPLPPGAAYAYGGMENGRGGAGYGAGPTPPAGSDFRHGGYGAPPVPPSHHSMHPGEYGGGGRNDYGDRYSAPGGAMMDGRAGQAMPGGPRDSEYDPTAVMPGGSQRPMGGGGGVYDQWNGGGDGHGYGRQDGYGAPQGRGRDAIPHPGRGAQQYGAIGGAAQYNPEGRNPYSAMNQSYGNRQGGAYPGAVRGSFHQQQTQPQGDNVPPPHSNWTDNGAAYGAGARYGMDPYGPGHGGARGRDTVGYGGVGGQGQGPGNQQTHNQDWRREDPRRGGGEEVIRRGGGISNGGGMGYASGGNVQQPQHMPNNMTRVQSDPRSNGYAGSGPNNFQQGAALGAPNNAVAQGAGGGPMASSSGPAPGSVDIGKLTNLISAFQQQQQVQQGGAGPNIAMGGPRSAMPHAAAMGMPSQGAPPGGNGVSSLLASPAVQQALQNIGSAGRNGAVPQQQPQQQQMYPPHLQGYQQHQPGAQPQQNFYGR